MGKPRHAFPTQAAETQTGEAAHTVAKKGLVGRQMSGAMPALAYRTEPCNAELYAQTSDMRKTSTTETVLTAIIQVPLANLSIYQ
ncbi:hypothetical protein NDU88_000700 [Pleurodeles waltl]|uniref:Uncharacterized protein n=1 Tax=Pleurodeles waltl TaxID=8319 RepID=A0AAV7SXS0_PLEWA|nr:hypothetical protein NDU88_000700 [Pleurodeles waltl]